MRTQRRLPASIRVRLLLASVDARRAGPADDGTDAPELQRVLYNLIWRSLHGHVPSEALLAALRESLADAPPSIVELLGDVTCCIDLETAALAETLSADDAQTAAYAAARARFIQLAADFARSGVLSDVTLKEHLELSTLESCGLIESQDKFNRNMARFRTKLLYAAAARDAVPHRSRPMGL